jgi:type VI secretion system Hcp family effector
MKLLFTNLIALVLLSVTTAFSQGIYMEITGGSSPGSSSPYTGEIQLSSVQYGFSNTATIGSSPSGGTASRPSFVPITITKLLDPSSAYLQRTLILGETYQRVRINFYRAGTSGGRVLAYQVVLGTVFVTNYSASAAEGCTSGCPALAESISLDYGQIVTREFVNGTPTRTVSWDRVRNTETVNSFLLQTN